MPRYIQDNTASALNRSQQIRSHARQADMIKHYAENDYTLDYIRNKNEANDKYFASKTIINIASAGYDLICGKQTAEAGAQLSQIAKEANTYMNELIANGKASYVEDKNGNLVFSSSPEWEEYKANLRTSIGEGFLSSVKNTALNNFDLQMGAIESNAQKTLLTNAVAERDNYFASQLEYASQDDIAIMRDNNGIIPEGAMLKGIALIQSRNDWSPQVKQHRADQYIQQVVKGGIESYAVQLARTGGMDAVDSYLQKTNLSPSVINNITATATRSLNNFTKAYSDEFSSMMTEAIVSGEVQPQEVYSQIAKSMMGAAPEAIDEVMTSAKSTQRSLVSKMLTDQYNKDLSLGLEELNTTRDKIASGGYDALFFNIEDLEVSTLLKYDNQISSQETTRAKALGVNASSLSKHQSDLIANYDASIKNIYSRLENGSYSSGAEAFQDFIYLTSATNEQMFFDKSIGSATNKVKLDTMAQVFFDEFTDKVIPSKSRELIKNKLDILFAAQQLTGNKLTEDQQAKKNQLKTYTYGYISDCLYDAGKGEINDTELSTLLDELTQSTVMSNSNNSNAKDILSGKTLENTGSNYKAKLNWANNANDTIWQSEVSKFWLYDDNAAADIENAKKPGTQKAPAYKYANDNIKNTYDELVKIYNPLIREISPEGSEIIATPALKTITDIYGNSSSYHIPTPQFLVISPNGEMNQYVFKGDHIYKYIDGRWANTGFASDIDLLLTTEEKEELKMMQEKPYSNSYVKTNGDTKTTKNGVPYAYYNGSTNL